jgi:hypothetical protein
LGCKAGGRNRKEQNKSDKRRSYFGNNLFHDFNFGTYNAQR